MMSTLSYTLGQLAAHVGAEVRGDADLPIQGLATLQEAGPAQLSFLANPQYRKYLPESRAGAVLLTAADADGFAGTALVVANPYLAYASLSHLFDRKPKAAAGIHPTAIVAADAEVDPSASVGAYAVIESGARIGAGVSIGAHCVIGARSVIGEGGWLAPRVTLYHDVTIGARVSIQSGAVIGGEGFGFANEKGVWQKIAQIGGVTIGDDVEIGANTTIDRGALSDTRAQRADRRSYRHGRLRRHFRQRQDRQALHARRRRWPGRPYRDLRQRFRDRHDHGDPLDHRAGIVFLRYRHATGGRMEKKRRAHSSTGRHGASTSAAGKTPGCRDLKR